MKTSNSSFHHNRKILLIFLAFTCSLCFLSCEKHKTSGTPHKKEGEGIHKSVERGPIKVTLDIDKKSISIADRITLTIGVNIEEDYDVKLPAFGDKLEQFGIVDYHDKQPELTANNRKELSRSYILEPFLSGDYKIPPMKILFYKSGEEKTNSHEIETPEAVVKVRSLLPEDLKKLKLNDIIPPLPYPRSYKIWIISGTALLVLLLIAGGFFYYRYRISERDAPGTRLKAHEVAYNELKALVDENLVEKGEIKLFYLRLSAIVRHYIENRFGLRAPEQTTEEFLFGLEKTDDFPDEYKPLLNKFLRHCDLVKFARFQPMADDIQNSFDSCKAFIQGTEEQE